jgi:hypothetical protein
MLISLTAAVIVVQFIIFKICYPLPNFMPPDSYSYLEAAHNNQTINTWAIGYSKFLRLFSCFTNSSATLVWFQYILLEFSIIYFLFSIQYLIHTTKWLNRILLIISIMNPLITHISNFVSSDALFTALSLIWFTQLLWILYRPSLKLILFHSVILLLVFMVRFNALYFPLLSIAAILSCKLKFRSKALGISAIFILITGFIMRTEYQYYKATKTLQLSAFGGWQLAANALYGYAYTSPDAPNAVPKKFQRLQTIVNKHMDSLRDIAPIMRPDNHVGVYYLWDFKSPLRLYQESVSKPDTLTSYFDKWASLGPLYASYGRFIIYHHPIPFLRHYIWPNFLKYYIPPAGFMESYVIGNSQVDPIAAFWFHWKSRKVYNSFNDTKIEITQIFPPILAVVNLLYVLSFLAIFALGSFKKGPSIRSQVLLWSMVIWLTNMAFSVFAAPIELRYQLFPMITTFVFTTILLAQLIEECRNISSTRISS